MRMKQIVENRTLKDTVAEFYAFKQAQKIRERTLQDYRRYIDPFVEQSSDSMNVNVLKKEILEYFAAIPATSPARYNHPYQYLHALFVWCAKQDYLPYNPFDKLDLKKLKDEGNIKPATIEEIQRFLNCLDKHNYVELRDFTITMVMLDTGIRTSEILALTDGDFNSELQSITIRPEVAKTSKSRTVYLSPVTNTALKKYLKIKPTEWDIWLFPTRDGKKMDTNVLGRNFRRYCERSGTKFSPYQIRHSFATFWLQNGGDLFTLQKQMGHSDLSMTKRYTEISDTLLMESHNNYSPIGLLQNSSRRTKV